MESKSFFHSLVDARDSFDRLWVVLRVFTPSDVQSSSTSTSRKADKQETEVKTQFCIDSCGGVSHLVLSEQRKLREQSYNSLLPP